ncbi:MAG: hypothetical protein ABEH78_09505 [Haloferacaceae archaeon]
MTGSGLPFPLSGSTLITGPSNAGKTTLTAHALAAWLDEHGPRGVVLLEFGPEFEHEGRTLGRRLSRYTAVPDETWTGVLGARAPRAESDTDAEAVDLAADNAERAAKLIAAAPADPTAVFVNDATIPFQHESGDPESLLAYCDRADVAVLNAFESDELGTDDPISRAEEAALAVMRAGCDRALRMDRRDAGATDG